MKTIDVLKQPYSHPRLPPVPRPMAATLICLGVTLTVALIITLAAYFDHQEVRKNAALQAHTLSVALLEHADRTIAEADRALTNLVASLHRQGGTTIPRAALRTTIEEIAGGLPQARGIFLIDHQGHVLAEVADQPAEVFTALSESQSALDNQLNTATLSTAYSIKAARNEWVVYLSRPFQNETGEIGGHAVIAIDARYFDAFYASLDLGEDGLVALIHANGHILFRAPILPAAIDVDVSRRPLFTEALAKADSGTFETKTGTDDVQRIQGFARSGKFPLVALTGLSTRDVFVGWHSRLHWLLLMGGASVTVVLTLIITLHRKALSAGLGKHRLAEAERNLSLAQAIAHVGSWHWDLATNTLWWSDEMRRIYGLTDPAEPAAYGTFLMAVHPDDRPNVAATIGRSLSDGRSYTLDYRIVTADGTRRHMHHEGRCQTDEAKTMVLRMDCIVQDVTESTLLQAELAQTTRLATLGEMATGMAHELSQPLNNIRMIVDAALLGDLDTSVHRSLEDVSGQMDRMSRIIEHIRIFSHQDVETVRTFDAVEAARLAVALTEPHFTSAGIALVVDADIPASLDDGAALAVMIKGRPAQFEQVLINLLTNARQSIIDHATDRPLSTVIKTPPHKVCVRLTLTDQRLLIAIEDTGSGVPPGLLGRLFEPFFSTREVGAGIGLGLSVSYGIITAMGGTLTARNQPGSGAVFTIALPTHGTATRTEAGTPDSILLVSAEGGVWDGPRGHLVEMGMTVIEAAGCAEAYRAYLNQPASLLVTNIAPDDPEGEALIRRLRILNPALPIIIVQPTTADGMNSRLSTADWRTQTLSQDHLATTLPSLVDHVLKRSNA